MCMQIILGERITAGPSFGPAVCFQVLHVHMFHASPTRPRTLIAYISAEYPSGNAPTPQVMRRISRFSRSMALLVWIFVPCSIGTSQPVIISSIPSSTFLAASGSFIALRSDVPFIFACGLICVQVASRYLSPRCALLPPAPSSEPLEGTDPTGLVLLHPLGIV